MARELRDVLHHMLPEADPGEEPPPVPRAPAGRPAPMRADPAPAARPDPLEEPGALEAAAAAPRTLAVPVREGDRLRGALLWSITAEIDRRCGSATLLAPAGGTASRIWPGSGVVLAFADGPEALGRAAARLASARSGLEAGRSHGAAPGGWVLAGVPRDWVGERAGGEPLFRRTLLLTSPAERDLLDACEAAEALLGDRAGACVGVTIYGARSIDEARDAFLALTSATDRCPGGSVRSYGMLADEDEMLTAAGARRSVSDTAPRSLAARSLADVAGWILRDAPEPAGA